jgi:hypothetical protein
MYPVLMYFLYLDAPEPKITCIKLTKIFGASHCIDMASTNNVTQIQIHI